MATTTTNEIKVLNWTYDKRDLVVKIRELRNYYSRSILCHDVTHKAF